MIADILRWLTASANRPEITSRLVEHLGFTLVTLLLATAIGVPLGMLVGHTGKGRFAVVNLVNGARALPTLGLLYALILWVGPHLSGDTATTLPALFVLVILAVPPILAATYSGIEEVDPQARDAAKGMGMTGGQVLRQVELPCALPMIFSGVRSSLLQIVATATIAATVGLGGLGRFLVDGLATKDYAQMAGGALLVSALALVLDAVLAVIQRMTVSRGLTRRYRREPGAADAPVPTDLDPAPAS